MENNGCIIGLPQSLQEKELVQSAGSIDHFALLCEDIDELFEEMLVSGYEIVPNGVLTTKAWEPLACRCFMIKGPDNVKIEFCEVG